MIKIEQKNIKNKAFYYLSEQINTGKKFKKIQVYVGKNIPNNLSGFYNKLKLKEIELISSCFANLYKINKKINLEIYKNIEINKINFKYYFLGLSNKKSDIFWRDFAIKFIFESNSIEGSRLSKTEVEKIIKNKYVKKTINRKELVEVENSIKAFNKIRKNDFILNQNNIKNLHMIVVQNIGIEYGYKKREIIINNKETCSPKKIRGAMTELIKWWKKEQKQKNNPFLTAIKFHQKFELIHPFSDGNGRVGRLILIWMLIKNNYGVILFKNKNREKYFMALDSADEGRNNKLYRYSVEVYKKTFKEIST